MQAIQTQTLPTTTELLAMLRHSGWSSSGGPGRRGEIFFRTFQGGQIAHYARYHAAGAGLLLLAFEDLQHADPQELFKRYLHFGLETRMALAAAGHIGSPGTRKKPDWLLLRTADRIELVHLETERCEIRITDG